MVDGIRLSGFKAYGPLQTLVLRDLTFLFGPNSSGKSSLLQAILALSAAVKMRSFPEFIEVRGEGFDWGSPAHVAHLPHPLFLGFRLGRDSQFYDRAIDFYLADSHEGYFDCTEIHYQAHGTEFRFERTYEQENEKEYPIWRLLNSPEGDVRAALHDEAKRLLSEITGESQDVVIVDDNWYFDLVYLSGVLLPRVSLTLTYRRADEGEDEPASQYRQVWEGHDARILEGETATLLRDAVNAYREITDYLLEVSYLGPILDLPPRLSTDDLAVPDYVGPRGEHLATWFYQNPSYHDEINALLRKMEIGHEISAQSHTLSVAGVQTIELLLHDEVGSRDLHFQDVGFGISQLIPMLCELVRIRHEGGVLLVEQPELHLHPKWQMALMRHALLAPPLPGKRASIVAETHSEHMVLALRELRLEEMLLPNPPEAPVARRAGVAVVAKKSGEAHIQEMLWDNVTHQPVWPGGFFEERGAAQRKHSENLDKLWEREP